MTPAALVCAVLLLAVLTATAQQQQETLLLVHALYRHGARSPISTYPSDPNAGAWPQGPGQLTDEGKRNQLALGRWLRRRYSALLPLHYHMNHTRVRSTDVDRTLMSAQVNLAGLYPPQGDDVWTPDLPWQPIPVHTVPQSDDLLLKSYDHCSAYVRERGRVYASDNMTAFNARHAQLYEYLEAKSGKPIRTVQDVSYLYDALWIEWRANLTTPAWALAPLPGHQTPVFPDLMRPLNDLEFALFGATELQRRLGGGPLVREVLQQMQAAAEDSLEPRGRRLFAYSAHDTNLACLLTTLGVFNGVAPPLAACLLLELHRDLDSGNHSVQLWYRNSTDAEPYQLQLPGCQPSCPLQMFQQLTRDVTPDDVQAECDA